MSPITPGTPGELRELLTELRRTAAQASTEGEAKALMLRIGQITRAYRIQHGIGIPPTMAAQAQEIDPHYRLRPHLTYLSDQIARAVADVERGHNRMIAVSMPPRHGKSTLLSLYGPLWLLRRHPEWSIVTTSHDGTLVAEWARNVRRLIEDGPELGIALQRDGGAGSHWNTVEGGGLFAVSVRGPLTGRGARVLIIDDPVKDFVEAHSLLARQALWDWWLSVAQLRLEAPYLVIVVMCMTGDTPVLRPDGTETPLRDIRPGDEIATYENGQLTSSRVINWANQGPDTIYEIRMKSGISVRANARHPFLTVEDGVETWRRTDQLAPGSKVLRAVASGWGPPATSVTSPSPARASARRTTTRPAGRLVIARPPSTPSLAELRGSSIATGSASRSSTVWLASSEDAARAVGEFPTAATHGLTGEGSSASTTTTSLGRTAGSSATTATSPSATAGRPSGSAPSLTTWSVTPDEVVSVTLAGTEDVFDLQVERTENFIANGLVSHNTRWHEDDLVGRLLNDDYEGDPKDWQVISLPAVAEENDVLGRAPGDPLFSPLLTETAQQATERLVVVRRSVGSYVFSAMFQQRPAPAKGAIFDSSWWKYWTTDQSRATEDGRVVYLDPSSLTGGRWLDSWDCAFKSSGSDGSGWVVGQRWVRSGANRYLIAQRRGRWSFTQTIREMQGWAVTHDPIRSLCGHLVHQRLIEERANGAAIIDVLKEEISGLKAVNPTVSKEARARAVTPEIESGNVYIPHPADPGNEWVADFLSELRNFPHDVADDQVDALTQALSELRSSGRGQVTVPGGQRPDGTVTRIHRDYFRVVASDRMRRRS